MGIVPESELPGLATAYLTRMCTDWRLEIFQTWEETCPKISASILTILIPATNSPHNRVQVNYYRKAATAANPPTNPAPKPATFRAATFVEVADADADEEDAAPVLLEALVLAAVTIEAAVAPVEVADALVVVASVELDWEEDDGAEVGVEEAVESQVTDGGRLVTPLVEQSDSAYWTAACWSAGLQELAKQHAIPLRKLLFEQMHLISILPSSVARSAIRGGGGYLLHPAIWPPVVYCVRHVDYAAPSVNPPRTSQALQLMGMAAEGQRNTHGTTWQRTDLGNGPSGQRHGESKRGSLHNVAIAISGSGSGELR